MKLKNLFKRIGPGFITGAADDDPSGIATYTQTGVQFGYGQLWTALFSTPFMMAVQEMCGRIGMVTGRGLSGVIRTHYSRKILAIAVLLVLIANTINIGADLGAMAATVQLIFNLPFAFWLFFLTALTLCLEIFISYPKYAKFLKFLTFTLFAYVLSAFIVHQDWKNIAISTFKPTFSFSKVYLLNIMALLGTTISPYLFFWQADEEVEEEIENHKIAGIGDGVPKVDKRDIKNMRIDTFIGMIFANIIFFFIIITAASTLRANGITSIETAAQAAEALRPLAGNLTFFIFALGIIGAGMLAVPILAGSASYAIAEAVGWKAGLYKKLKEAHGFYGVITIATIVGLVVNFIGIPPFKMLYYTAVFNGLAAPPLLILILLISNNKKIMGKHTNGWLSNTVGIIITVIITVAGLAVLFS